MMTIIKAENQSWLDAFNRWSGHDFKMGQDVTDEDLALYEEIQMFNNEIAEGPAIRWDEVVG